MSKVFIISEVGPSHDGDLGKARTLIHESAKAGADAVKFQLHIAEVESTRNAPPPPYFNIETPYEFFERISFKEHQWVALKGYADTYNVKFIVSPFSLKAVDILEDIGVDAYKIASGEVTNLPMLNKISKLGKPVYLSTGMSDYAEISNAIKALEGADVTIMQCSSIYPCPYDKVGMDVLRHLRVKYGLPIGLSDHTLGISAPIVAVTQGATVIEKHITLTNDMIGPDASFSLTPDKFKLMVDSVREAEIMITTTVDKDDLTPYREMKAIFQKSVTALEDIATGRTIDDSMVALKKPGYGIQPKYFDSVIGLTALRDIEKDSTIYEKDLCSNP